MDTIFPRISVIIPVFNACEFVGKALRSVFSQSYSSYEVIVIDDGSSDASLALVRRTAEEFPEICVKIVASRHQGCGSARNLGIAQSRGELIAFLDADDSWMPEKLKKVAAVFDAFAGINLVSHDIIRHYPDGRRVKFALHKKYRPEMDYVVNMYQRNCLITSTVTIKKTLLEASGGFDNRFNPAEDFQLWMRLSPELKPYYIPQPLTCYVFSPASQSRNIELRMERQIAVLESCLPLLRQHSKNAGKLFRQRVSEITAVAAKEWLIQGNIAKSLRLSAIAWRWWPLNFKIFLYPFLVLYDKIISRFRQ